MTRVFSIPMTTRFRGITVREGALVEGEAGWGEWSPFVDYSPEVAEPWLRCAEEAAAGDWPGTGPRLRAGERHGSGRRRRRSPTPWCSAPGCATAKVKVADPVSLLADDLARVEAVRDALGPSGRVRVDANGAWDVDTAVASIAALDRAAGGLEYVEQPCATVEELALVRRRVGVPIAADESIRRAEDPYRVRDLEAADVAVLKVQPLGGVRACLRIAEDIGMPVVVSSALETSLGLAAGVALAAALPSLEHASGLATRALLTGDVATPELVPVNGALRVVVPTVVPSLLDAVRRAAGPGGVVGGPAGGGAGSAGGWALVNESTDLARAVIGHLVENGVREIVLAPGSRNAPLAFAAYDAAEAGLVRLHTRIDERSAGFLALGLTKAGSSAAVICTSGTAVANLHPAMLEAVHAGVPLIAVTADRPARLRGTNANQTTDQVGIFGSLVHTVDVTGGAFPDMSTRLGGPAAPIGRAVHLNVCFDDPLTPGDRWRLDLEVGSTWAARAELASVIVDPARAADRRGGG